MKEKPAIVIYLNNFIAFTLTLLLRRLLPKAAKGNNLLLINTGQIGDLIISSVFPKNAAKLLKRFDNIYFISKSEYIPVIKSFPQIQSIPWDYKRYKYNLFYRVRFLLTLRKIGFDVSINLTAARGVTVDELSLLSGGKAIYALNSNYRYLKKLFGGTIDKLYTGILAKNIKNEYEKHIEALKFLGVEDPEEGTYFQIREKSSSKILSLLQKYEGKHKIVISPVTDIEIKNWGLNNYRALIKKLMEGNKDCVIFLFGSGEQTETLNELTVLNKERIINLAGKYSITESAAMLQRCDLFIGNDSGFTHVAKALKKPLIAIIGGGAAEYFFPYYPTENEVYLYSEMECFGCEWRCRFDEAYCLSGVSVDLVLSYYFRLINENT